MPKFVQLDGTTLEGGGQLLRIALGIAALADVPVRITDIRGKRSGGGGLKNQHLTCVSWLASACAADIDGAELKSRTLEFRPYHNRFLPSSLLQGSSKASQTGPTISVDQKTPGSVGLVAQALLPFIVFSGSLVDGFKTDKTVKLVISGGTNVTQSPSYEYMSQVLLPTLALIGMPPMTSTLVSRGWTTGGTSMGSVQLNIKPLPRGAPLPAFHLQQRGRIQSFSATVIAPRSYERQFTEELDGKVNDRLACFLDNPETPLSITWEDSRHPKRWYLLLVASCTNGFKLGRDLLYDRKIRDIPDVISDLVKRTVAALAAELEHGGCVDEHMRDQLVVFQALAHGHSTVDCGLREGKRTKSSLHTKTAQWVAAQMLGVEFDDDGGCGGVGFVPGEKFVDRKKRDNCDMLVAQLDSLHIGPNSSADGGS